MEAEVLKEVPESLKRLVRLIVRGFYTPEHAIVIDMLVRNPCMKEEDLLELLKFEQKQLRAIVNSLKNDKFLKSRLRVETDEEKKMKKHNYYFINYQVFVNVVKYKLDHIRRKIEMEERDNTSRASFKCPSCQKTFTDLEVDQLFDFMSQKFICTICNTDVEEEEGALNKTDARTLLAKFNEQIEPIYELLKECEDIKLAPELLEPEPVDIRAIMGSRSRSTNIKPQDGEGKWSGDQSKRTSYGYSESTVKISLNEKNNEQDVAKKERPVWMVQSTVDGVTSMENKDMVDLIEAGASRPDTSQKTDLNEIETLLILHEKKNAGAISMPAIPGEESSSSDSDAESTIKPSVSGADVEEMESEDDRDSPMVTVGGRKIALQDITPEMVNKMTPEEREEYIKLSQELYADMYE
ncbi:hypothetical protein CHS0354_002730 [Potamilus streckersoni]|uniref:General transcription factor IIE subunit 1 n=1 Tax=Potamilus streckersoni TaxID=2493646 RepID=A0AAE0VWH8_9BIVA|nr:hypothetical protein CHS0354_002730 [Potamilus streckersoni]